MGGTAIPSLPLAGVSNPGHVEYCLSQRKICTGSHGVLATSKFHSPQRRATRLPLNSCRTEFCGREISKGSDSMICRCCNEAPIDPTDPSNDGGKPGKWDLHSRHKRFQAVAAKMGNPFLGMMSRAGKKFQDYLDSYKGKTKAEPTKEEREWDWDRWQEHFAQVDEHENLSSALKFQLEDAVKSEDFTEAARLKVAIAAAVANDTVAGVMSQLMKAVLEERYLDAAQIRDDTGAGLVGWWAGLAEGANDPYGRIIHIRPEHGRFVARSYSARQLAAAAPGVPLFEVFVTKDGNDKYKHQAVYLQRNGGAAGHTLSGSSNSINVNAISLSNSLTKGDKELTSMEATGESESDGERTDDSALEDEGLGRIINFLRDRIPGIKLKVLKVMAPERADTDMISRVFEQLMQEVDKEDEKTSSSNGSSEEVKADGDLHGDKVTVGGDSDFMEERNKIAVKLVIGGLLQIISEDMPPRVPVRVPARIENRGRGSFSFHIEDDGNRQQAREKEMAPSWKVATIATQTSADPMPPDVRNVFWNGEKVPVKVLKDVGEIIKLAVGQAQKRHGLFGSTVFHRINMAQASADPLNGLYVGAFGPYTSEVVQLRRRFGQWHDDYQSPSKSSKFNFFEYVEAVKLTGDLNVPAGQVTFRAKIGKENQLPHRAVFPEDLGVVARYKGQGRLAEPGFRNPQWIDGELVLLDGKAKGFGHPTGAQLGFIYSGPERHFLVLFSRLELQE